jgi:hypothetical protein
MKRALPTVQPKYRIASPCTESWEAMTGDDKKRFCGICNKHVHDLGTMKREEAAALVRGGGVCVRVRKSASLPMALAAGVAIALSAACSADDGSTPGPGGPDTPTVTQPVTQPVAAGPDAGNPAEIHMMGDVEVMP